MNGNRRNPEQITTIIQQGNSRDCDFRNISEPESETLPKSNVFPSRISPLNI